MTASLSQCQGGYSTVGYLDYNVKQIILHIELHFFYMISHLVPKKRGDLERQCWRELLVARRLGSEQPDSTQQTVKLR